MIVAYPRDTDFSPNVNKPAEALDKVESVQPTDLVVIIQNGQTKIVTVDALLAGGAVQSPEPQ
jgi:hypothetical protein